VAGSELPPRVDFAGGGENGLARRRGVRPRTVAAAAVAIALLAAVSSWAFDTRNSREAPRAAGQLIPVVPTNGSKLPYGAAVTGSCRSSDRSRRNEIRGWGVYTIDPGGVWTAQNAGRHLAPTTFASFKTPPGLDAYASTTTRPDNPAQWQVGAGAREMPTDPTQDCAHAWAADAPDATVSSGAVVLRRPGPYVYWTFDHVVRWVKVPDVEDNPTPRDCPQEPVSGVTSPSPVGYPPSTGGNGWHWAVASFCTRVSWRSFDVLGTQGRCSASRDASEFPRADYINQYAAGARLHLPVGEGRPGGNACGPSSMLMAMVQSEHERASGAGGIRARVPTLKKVFDETMMRPRAQVSRNGANDFVGVSAANVLRKLGWRAATLGRFEAGSPNEAALDRALATGPVLVRTAFGTGPWGTTGPGHMIVIIGRAPQNRDEYVVYDPAGNYFSSPTGHYDASSCGSAVLYPASWVLAYATGGWYLALGPS
jgi:hypothetical protein